MTIAQVNRGIRRATSPVTTKFLSGVGDRQVRVVASDATPDRMGDVLDPAGCDLRNYYKNPVVLAQHDSNQPIARCSDIAVRGGQVVATIEFPPAGTSDRSDEYLALLKARILGAVSVGFLPIAYKPRQGGGFLFTEWELLELSVVSVPANPSAVVTERSFGGTNRRAADLARAARIAARIATPAVRIDHRHAADLDEEFRLSAIRADAERLHNEIRHRHALAVAAALSGPSW